MIKFFDTHIHLPTPNPNGLATFKSYVEKTPNMLGGLLILNTQEEVDFVASHLDQIPDQFIIVPYYNYISQSYPHAVTSSGWLKIHPVLSRIANQDIPEVVRFLKNNRKDLRGVIVHCFPWGTAMEYNFSLQLVLELNREFPDLKILIAHGGGYESWIFRAHTGSIKNVLYDFSASLKYYEGSDLLRPLQRYLKYSSDRILFGSDYPVASADEQMAECIRLAEEVGINYEKLESLFVNNFLTVWGHLFKSRNS